MWFFNTHCNVPICDACTTGLNGETAAADKWSSTSAGVLNTRPLCWSVHLSISKRTNCLFRPRRIIQLYTCMKLSLPCAATVGAGEQSEKHDSAREDDAILSSSKGSRFWDCTLLNRFWEGELRYNLIFHVSRIIYCTSLIPLSFEIKKSWALADLVWMIFLCWCVTRL